MLQIQHRSASTVDNSTAPDRVHLETDQRQQVWWGVEGAGWWGDQQVGGRGSLSLARTIPPLSALRRWAVKSLYQNSIWIYCALRALSRSLPPSPPPFVFLAEIWPRDQTRRGNNCIYQSPGWGPLGQFFGASRGFNQLGFRIRHSCATPPPPPPFRFVSDHF